MHPNPIFRGTPRERNLGFARERGFGTLAVTASGAPLLSHVPFLLSDDGAFAELHLVRSNPIARACKTGLAARIAVQGPDSYISPDWYGIDDQVPTWNYVAVHLTGRLEPLPQAALRDVIDRQTALFEERLAPKPQWTSAKMPADLLERMMRTISPFILWIDDVDGTWKLNQNKVATARQSAAENVAAYGQGQEIAMLAALMRGVDSDAEDS